MEDEEESSHFGSSLLPSHEAPPCLFAYQGVCPTPAPTLNFLHSYDLEFSLSILTQSGATWSYNAISLRFLRTPPTQEIDPNTHQNGVYDEPTPMLLDVSCLSF